MTTETNPTILLLFIGYDGEWDEPAKLLAVFREVTEEEVAAGEFDSPSGVRDKRRLFGLSRSMKKALRYHHPGQVVEVEGTPETIVPSTMKFATLWPEADDRTEWAAASRAAERRAEGLRASKKADPFLGALVPIREAYKNGRGANRAQLLAAVVEYITK